MGGGCWRRIHPAIVPCTARRQEREFLACRGRPAGYSGGPWLTGFSPRTLYGTVLGPAARALYLKASA
jgi:hypothetical protein